MKYSLFELLADFYTRRKFFIFVAIISVASFILIISCLFFGDIIWREFIYRYFWGPIESDKAGHPINGIYEGYNVLSTLVYGILLIFSIFIMYRICLHLRINIETAFIVAAIPFILFGGISRALEDACLFSGTIQYLFISPIIYIFTIALFSLTIVAGIFTKRRKEETQKKFVCVPFCVLIGVLLILHFVAFTLFPSNFNFTPPLLLPIAFAVLTIIAYCVFLRKASDILVLSILFAGLFLVFWSTSFVIAFFFSPEWQSIVLSKTTHSLETRPIELLIIPGIAGGLTGGVAAIGFVGKSKANFLSSPVNLILIFSHLLDGVATYRGIDLYEYGEKHVLPTFFIEIFGSAVIMVVIKLVLVILILILIDVLFRRELIAYPNLPNITKFVLIFLGLAPGVRDALRISMGV
ncbi:MAG: DUF63 family protein [Methanomassiliicoccales archaeon]|nr:DUF63 family protein [Methanomassiliicoccales archaeon]